MSGIPDCPRKDGEKIVANVVSVLPTSLWTEGVRKHYGGLIVVERDLMEI